MSFRACRESGHAMQKEAEKFGASTLMEGMVSIRAVLRAGKEGIGDRRIEEVLFDREKTVSKARDLAFLQKAAKEAGFSIRMTNAAEIESLAIGNSHGGILARCTKRAFPDAETVPLKQDGFYVMLEGIEDPYNFGYCLRSLYAAGVDGIFLEPRNWMEAAGVVCRASAGASELLPVAVGEPTVTIRRLRREGFAVVAADLCPDAVPIYDTQIRRPVLLVVGGEKRGITRAVLDQCDKIVSLDYGRRLGAALSAASAASILAFEIFRQNRGGDKS